MQKLLRFIGTVLLVFTIIGAIASLFTSLVVTIALIFQGLFIYAITFGLADLLDKNDAILNSYNSEPKNEEPGGSMLRNALAMKEAEDPNAKVVKYKKCPDCGHKNFNYVNTCVRCYSSLNNAELVDKE